MIQDTDVISISTVEVSVRAQGQHEMNIILWKHSVATGSVMESEQ